MLSPLDLQNKKVVTKKRKYDKIEMDEYLDLVFENYKELFNQNQELQKQIKTLSDGIQYYRSIESTMQKALVLAEKTSKETKDAAILKAEAIEKDANTRASKIVSAAEQEYESIKDKCLYLVQQFNQYKMRLKQVAAAQLELITSDSFDVYSPELDGLYNSRHSLTDNAQESNRQPVNVVRPQTVPEPEENLSSFPVNGDTQEIPDVDSYAGLAPEEEEEDIPAADISADDSTDISMDGSVGTPFDSSHDTVELPEEEPDPEEEMAYVRPSEKNFEPDLDLQPVTEEEEDMSDISETHPAEPDLSELDKTTVLPDIRTELEKGSKELSEEDTLSLLTADTIDLSGPMEQIAREKKKQQTPLEPEKKNDAEAPTLDSLLQNMNLGKKKKKKKGQDEDPFEFLGSVDDF